MSVKRWKSGVLSVCVTLFAILGNVYSVLADGPPPPPPGAPHLVPAAGAVLIIGGLVGYGIYRLRKRK